MSFTRTILITGSTDGIGKHTAINLARSAENFVIVHGRSVARAEQAVADIKKVVGPTANLDYAVGDFGSMKSVAAMAVDVRERFPKLNVLLLNAGVLLPQRTESSDKIELTFQVNHLAHFLLTQRLIDTLKANSPSRVIVVSSICEAWHPIAWDDLECRSNYDKYVQYSRTKLENLLFTFALARRLEGTGVTSNALEPGVVESKLLHAGDKSGAPVENGAVAPTFLTTDPTVAMTTGKYFNSFGRLTRSCADSLDVQQQERLWTISEEWIGKLGV